MSAMVGRPADPRACRRRWSRGRHTERWLPGAWGSGGLAWLVVWHGLRAGAMTPVDNSAGCVGAGMRRLLHIMNTVIGYSERGSNGQSRGRRAEADLHRPRARPPFAPPKPPLDAALASEPLLSCSRIHSKRLLACTGQTVAITLCIHKNAGVSSFLLCELR